MPEAGVLPYVREAVLGANTLEVFSITVLVTVLLAVFVASVAGVSRPVCLW